MRWATIGCGVIGKRRSEAIPESSKLVAVYDAVFEKASELASGFSGAKAARTLQELFAEKPDIVIVSTINAALKDSLQACLSQGVACLVEKPAARGIEELESLEVASSALVKVGFNHRFHPAFEDLLKELRAHPDDEVMYVRARYGNGARLGFDQEWRSKVELAGGGELLDQGVHVLDLALQILPDLKVSSALVKTHFWKMSVDDNAWALLTTSKNQSFSMHVSSTEWKNEFHFDVYTKKRRYVWTGLGRSYGPEQLKIFSMKEEMGPPDVEERSYPAEDNSWKKENKYFQECVEQGKSVKGSLVDARKCLSLVKGIYESSWELQGRKSQHPLWWERYCSEKGTL